MDDYHTLFLRKDIVDEDETKGIQCLIQQIEAKMKGKETEFKQGWSSYFKKMVKEMQTKHFIDPTTNKPCEISYDEKTQCVRFFEEWAEEFCLLKRDLGQMLVSECGTTPGKSCEGLCNIYEKFLKESQPYFKNYKTICAQSPFGNNESVKDLEQSFIQAANNSMNECCKDNGNCSDTDLFDLSKDNSNIRYKCLCEKGDYYNDRDKKDECRDYVTQTTVAGQIRGPPALRSASQSVASVACGIHSGRSVKVEDIARVFQTKVQEQLRADVGNVDHDSKSVLIGKPEQGEYKQGGEKSLFKSKPCDITIQHSNDSRNKSKKDGDYDGPCTGKGGDTSPSIHTRFVVGVRWEADDKGMRDKHKDVIMPPRRRHICTSNLENLDLDSQGLKDGNKANDSFLGDVLLSAKEEANKIISMYKDKNNLKELNDKNHKESVCRAMKNSFADLGDIIRGRDLWSRNQDMKHLEDKLKEIFKKIQEELTNKSQYESVDGKYTKLRENWWEANRDQIWKAMTTCGNTTNICDSGSTRGPRVTPHDDYIPQRLRWLAEWSEWYCKRQAQLYGELKGVCNGCTNGNNSGTCDTNKCKDCKEKCTAYKQFIEEWQKDWKTMEGQYLKYYSEAQNLSKTSGVSSNNNDQNQKYLEEFLYQLHTRNNENNKSGTNNPFESAAGYVHHVLPNTGCEKQTKFCGDNTNQDNVFKNPPHEYDNACNCDSSTPCDIVKTLLKDKSATDTIDSCNPKKTEKSWDCNSTSVDTAKHNGACMPPRRQSLCIHNLENLSPISKDALKQAFIKCAAKETFFLWHKYKEHHSTEAAKLKTEGTIPEEFKRQMFYTLGDYRDFCLNSDISKKDQNSGVGKVKKNIEDVFSNNGPTTSGKTRESWWKEIEKDIWDGMLCSLGYDETKKEVDDTIREKIESKNGYNNVKFGDTTSGSTTGVKLPQFVARPQFLRWMTEWGEHFCKQHKVQFTTLKEKCDRCNANKPSSGKATCDKKSTECTDCQTQCEQYKTWIGTWKGHYDKQKKKYTQDKNKADYKTDTEVQNSQEAHDYINKQIKKICQNSGTHISCDCMKEKSQKSSQPPNPPNSGVMPQTLDQYPPGDYENQCTCVQKPPTPPTCTGNKILDAANIKQYDAENEVHTSGVNLVGNIGKAEFKKGKKGSDLGGEICSITKEHTNDTRKYSSTVVDSDQLHYGPCTGKGKDQKNTRFIIGQKWDKDDNNVNPKHTGVLLPPRRKHMCTSNLENLDLNDNSSGLLGASVNHSFLGDVLLAAKFEGDDIVEKHLSKGDKSGICNAMKYSFADLGDIIRGKDMWSKNNDMENLENNLKSIFKKIHENLPPGTKTKYAGDGPKYTKLREAWWSANRDQVWKALTCNAPAEADLYIPSSDTTNKRFERYKCGRDSYVPPDDYIPQRLRWMTEWSESYCKQLEKNYWLLKGFCQVCKKHKEKGKENEAKKSACTFCSKSCEVYKDHVEKWKGQWEKQETEYNNLYQNSNSSSSDPIKQQENNFMKTVKDTNGIPHCTGKNSDTTEYNTLGNYVSSMGGSTYCNDTTQKKFDDTNSQDTESVFKQHPNKYEDECKWKPDTPKTPTVPNTPGFLPPKGPKNPEEVCKTVKTCIEENNQKINAATGSKGDCNEKTDPFNWECNGKVKSGEEGACMPHRRQKLCVHYLKELTGDKTTDDLRQAFIKCAALETYFAWDKYKKDKQKEDPSAETKLDEQLKSGTIPDDFLRSIFFSYADYRDLCLDKDIGKRDGDVKEARQNIDNVFKNGGQGKTKTDPKNWWNENGLDILQGMICALSNTVGDSEQASVQAELLKNPEYKYDPENLDTKIANYVLYTHTVPQFLRWYTEWSEEFCDKQKKEFAQLYSKCHKCEITSSSGKATCKKSGTECSECQDQCPKYTSFIQKWKRDWDKQNQHYNDVKNIDPYEYAPFVDTNNHAYTYLNESLELLGLHNNCMQEKTSQKTSPSDDTPKSLDDLPKTEYKDKCECDDKVVTPQGGGGSGGGSHVKPMPNPNPSHPGSTQTTTKCEIDKYVRDNENTKTISTNNGKKYCNEKTDPFLWKCGDQYQDLVNDQKLCMSPRRQKLCIHYLQNDINGAGKKEEKDLKEALIKSISLETYFWWQKYKSDHPKEASQLQSGTIPEGFKRQMMYTLGDFKDLCLGSDLGIHTGTSDIKDKVKKILNGGTYKDNPDKWWESIEKEVWEAMVCSLSYSGGTMDADTQKKLENKNNYNSVTFSGVPTSSSVPTSDGLAAFASRPQFLRWLTEWYDDYCKQKHTKLKDVETACKPQGDIKCNEECTQKCNDYTNFMNERKGHWGKQQGYYTSEKQKQTTGTSNAYDEPDATKYLKKNFTVTCGSDTSSGATTSSGADQVEKNINALTPPAQSPPQTSSPQTSSYYDADVYCGCKKYINDDDYTNISGKNNCEGLKNEAEDTTQAKPENGIKWRNKEDSKYKHLETNAPYKKDPVPKEVFLPPRRQKLCFKDLDTQNSKITDEKTLREQLMKVAATEGYNLGQYYKEKKIKEEQKGKIDEQELKKYAYDVEACRAMKYSFLDLRDIIIGHDMLEPEGTDTGKNIKQIFEKLPSNGNPNDINAVRKQWWTQNQQCVWNAMKCGYKKSGDTNIDTCNQPSDNEYPVATDRTSGTNYQFLRWFAEWGEDFCVKQIRHYKELDEKCKDVECKKNGQEEEKKKQACKEQCEKYKAFITQWKAQYNKQKTKYDTLKGENPYKTLDGVKDSTHAYQYLDKSLKKSCKNSGTNSGSTECNCMKDESTQQQIPPSPSGKNIPKSLEYPPSGYIDKCECVTSQVGPGPNIPPAPAQPGQPQPQPQPDGSVKPGQGKDPKQEPGQKDPSQSGNSDPNNSNGGSVGPPGGSGGPNSGGQGTNTNHSSDPTNQGARGHSNPIGPIPGEPKPGPVSPSSEPKKNTDEFEDLNECPDKDKSYCNKYGKYGCRPKKRNIDLNNWSNSLVKSPKNMTNDILVPPRRRHLCFNSIRTFYHKVKDEKTFKEHLLYAAYNEAKQLYGYYGRDHEKLLDAMKYSFADIGDIVKGDDMLNDGISDKIKTIFDKNIIKDKSGNDVDPKKWWETNKKHVWNVMMCHYKGNIRGSTNNSCPEYDKIDETSQFLRWLTEWAQLFCKEKLTEAKTVVEECIEKNHIKDAKTIKEIENSVCKQSLKKYKDWYLKRKPQWDNLTEQYDKYKQHYSNGSAQSSGKSQQLPSTAEKYITSKCPECDCNYNDLQKISDYQDKEKEILKKLILKAKIDTIDPKNTIFYHIFNIGEKGLDIAKTVYEATPDVIPTAVHVAQGAADIVQKVGTAVGKTVEKSVINGLNNFINWFNTPTPSQNNVRPPPQPVGPDASNPGGQTPSITPGVTPETVSLSTIPPVGISAIVLGAIGFLWFYYMKVSVICVVLYVVCGKYVFYIYIYIYIEI
ncbi:erythrocyte membrane protein 1, PfEMP1, putative [Plasmodium sp. gorilla clade G2]|uniref:erythrocyte membrane protein 1, PfEMP1, putative n=1 Tax=Plasmodium sp. gorilla clade G2 TaxID=880535 RepID=UPI000D2EC25B|nr:erythrocyte membrane protein 1, PfEMP1, putative [Plasmodium sp. gorilla clade G2]SOV20281.1 erythrocyte membrane protein 1, PfEMP1, putative [Plasmodium sp. gorilla clade G2]